LHFICQLLYSYGNFDIRSALDGDCGLIAANLYANSVFGEDVLVNICVEKQADGKLSGCIRIKGKIEGMILSLGRTLSQVIPLLI
jgi:coatomer subunit beta